MAINLFGFVSSQDKTTYLALKSEILACILAETAFIASYCLFLEERRTKQQEAAALHFC